MSSQSQFAAWLIDLDGTLYRQKPVRLAMAAELLLLAPHKVRTVQAFRREQERIRAEGSLTTACSYQLQLERTAQALGCSTESVTPVIRTWMEERPAKWLRLFTRKSLIDEIKAFRQAGGKTALVSDYPATTKLKGMRLETMFDAVVASGEPGGPRLLKPHPEGYLLAAERLEISPSSCLVIGDRDDADGEAARRAGMVFRHIR
jgi:HAD superfamily hydrolase (TIGR01549 family)